MKKIVSLGMIVFGLFSLVACEEDESGRKEPVKYVVTSGLVKDTIVTKSYVCQIRAIQHIEVRALEKSYLEKIFVDEGQLVPQGKLMFKMVPLVYNAELKKAEAEANFASVEYKNTQALAESNVVSSNELALAKAKLDKAKAEVLLAQAHLKFLEIRAPFSGIMDRFHVRLGSLVDEGDLLTTLSDNTKMWVYFNVSEAEYLDYKSRMNDDGLNTVSLLMANGKRFDYPGKVETIEGDFNNETGNIAFRAIFPNPKGLLRHGETGNVETKVPLKQALIIPQKATFEVLEKKYVFVVIDKEDGKEGKVEQREIAIDYKMPDLYVVSSGLKASDKIVLEGINKIKNNDEIEYSYEDPQKVISALRVYVE